jgi:hypothetical protein
MDDSILSREVLREWCSRYIGRGYIYTGTGSIVKVSQGDVKGDLAVIVYGEMSIDKIKIRFVRLYL